MTEQQTKLEFALESNLTKWRKFVGNLHVQTWVAAKDQWIRLHPPSCDPEFESPVQKQTMQKLNNGFGIGSHESRFWSIGPSNKIRSK